MKNIAEKQTLEPSDPRILEPFFKLLENRLKFNNLP